MSNLSLQKLLRKKRHNFKSDLTIIQLNEKIFIFHHDFKVFLSRLSVSRLFDDTAATAITKGPNHVPNPWIVLDFPFFLFSSSLNLSSVSAELASLCPAEAGQREKWKRARDDGGVRILFFYYSICYWNTQREPLQRTEKPVRFQ